MKKVALAPLTALALLTATPSSAVETNPDLRITGRQVIKLCNSWGKEDKKLCAMTTIGVLDAINYVALMSPGMKYDGVGEWCFSLSPEELEELISKMRKHYKTDEIYKEAPFTFLVISTLKTHFTCKKVSIY